MNYCIRGQGPGFFFGHAIFHRMDQLIYSTRIQYFGKQAVLFLINPFGLSQLYEIHNPADEKPRYLFSYSRLYL